MDRSELHVGDRVELHPGTDSWMRGDRYGKVTVVGRLRIWVEMDRSGRIIAWHPSKILKLID